MLGKVICRMYSVVDSMYATETDSLDCTELHKMMFMQSYLVMGVFTGITSLNFAVLAALDSSYPAATSTLVGAFAAHVKIWQAFRFRDYYQYIRNY